MKAENCENWAAQSPSFIRNRGDNETWHTALLSLISSWLQGCTKRNPTKAKRDLFINPGTDPAKPQLAPRCFIQNQALSATANNKEITRSDIDSQKPWAMQQTCPLSSNGNVTLTDTISTKRCWERLLFLIRYCPDTKCSPRDEPPFHEPLENVLEGGDATLGCHSSWLSQAKTLPLNP